MSTRSCGVAVALACALAAQAADQVWNDGLADNTWSTNAANWDAGAVWENGNSAVFAGAGGTQTGETVNVDATITVKDVSFLANGYVIADPDDNGTLALVGAPSILGVPPAQTATVSEVVGGSGGLKLEGGGALALTARTNLFTGALRVSSGSALLLSRGSLYALGTTGAGNETVVEAGATLNFNGAYTNNGLATAEQLHIAGAGVDGLGALVNTGTGFMNGGVGALTLLGDATIGGPNRIDLRNPVVGNGYTLTKTGACELAVGGSAAVTNCAIAINQGTYTYMHPLALGGADYDTTLNGGALRSYGTYDLAERLIGLGGGIIAAGAANTAFRINGTVALSNTVGLAAEGSSMLELNGRFEGPGGLRRGLVGNSNGGAVYFFSTNSTYAGQTQVDSGYTLYVGRTNLYQGVLGAGLVTNAGTLYGYSALISRGPVINTGSIYCKTGELCLGFFTNNGTLYIDRGGMLTLTNAVFGAGTAAIRYEADVRLDGTFYSNGVCFVAHGTLTLTNGATVRLDKQMTLCTRDEVGYSPKLTNLVAEVNVLDGTVLQAQAIIFGNGNNLGTGTMTGVLNQSGGSVRTTGSTDQGNGMRLGHWPQARGFYNMMGGTLTVGADWDLCCATDGQGTFNQTGGEVYVKRVMLNERDIDLGFGTLRVSGGVLNVGSLTGEANVYSNGIMADARARYLVELGGAGGTIRAVTNLWIPASATLVGTGVNAITFDTREWTVTMTNKLTGAGGLNKAGAGTLVLSGMNTYSGPTRVLEGALVRGAAGALPAGGQVLFGVTADDAGGRMHSDGDLSLSGIVVGVANPEELDESKSYTIATYGGDLAGRVDADALPEPWYVCYDWAGKRVLIKAAVGTVVIFR